MKNFKTYTIKNIEELIGSQESPKDSFKLKKLKKIKIFTKKDFKKWKEDNDVLIVGNIRRRQKKYKDYQDQDELVKKKHRKKIYGKAELISKTYDCVGCNDDGISLTNHIYKFDVREPKTRHTVGYAWLGGQKFLRVTTFNPLWILLLLLILALIGLGLWFLSHWCQTAELPVQGEKIVEEVKKSGYKVLYIDIKGYDAEDIILDKSNKSVTLIHINSEKNKKFLLQYKLYLGDKLIYQTFDAKKNQIALIKPGGSVKANIYDFLQPGENIVKYEITAYTTEKFKRVNTFYENVKIIKQ